MNRTTETGDRREKPATSLTGEEICTERNFREREGLGSVGR
jgi:hypothetical protein